MQFDYVTSLLHILMDAIGSWLASVSRVMDALGKLLSNREAIASYDSYASVVLSNLPRAYITRWTQPYHEPTVNWMLLGIWFTKLNRILRAEIVCIS